MFLVAAPFIEAVKGKNGNKIFRRIDSNATPKIKFNHILEEILKDFNEVVLLEDYLAKKPHYEEYIHQLIKLEYLIDIKTITTPIPSIELEITNACNANCIMCPREELRPIGRMDEFTFDKLIDFLKETENSGIIIQGIGEPLMHKNLVNYVKKLRMTIGDKPILIVSNGSFLDKDKLAELFDAGLTHIQVSFHSLNMITYNKIMGNNIYTKTRKNLEECIEDFPEKISINVVEMESNKNDIPELKSYFKSLGLPTKSVQIIPCFSRGGMVDSSLYNTRGNRTHHRCLYIMKSIFVTWDGNILPCSSDIRGENIVANLNVNDSTSIIKRWIKMVKNPVDFEMCKGCDKFVLPNYETEWFNEINN